MSLFPKALCAAATILTALIAQPAEAKRHSHHHGFHAHHSHASHSHHSAHRRSFPHHVAHYAVNYGVHYEIRRAVRASLAPIDGRAHPVNAPLHPAQGVNGSRHVVAAADPAAVIASVATPSTAADPANPARTEFAHAGPRLGVVFAPGAMRVVAVTEGTPAYAAGVDPGDIVTKAGGHSVNSAEDFARAITAAAPSGALKLTVQRAGKAYDATIALDQPAKP